MNKEQLIGAVMKRTKLSKKLISDCLTHLIQTMTSTLSKGEKVTLVGFGTFQTRNRKARVGRNPRTGKKLQIAARKAPVFTAGKTLKGLISPKKGQARADKPAASKKAPAAPSKPAASKKAPAAPSKSVPSKKAPASSSKR